VTRGRAKPAATSAVKTAVIAPCIGGPGGAKGGDDWPENIISRRAIVYDDGVIARVDEAVAHPKAPDELALCQRMSNEAMVLMEGIEVGMESEASTRFSPFFVPGPRAKKPPRKIDEALIRRAFGGTIFPPATITVEPMKKAGVWWREVLRDGEGQPASYLKPWRNLIKWFAQQENFLDAAFIRIGDRTALDDLDSAEYPDGTDTTGCVLPRLAVGLTRAGSLAGLFGYVVQT
jgi:hypothetical protein